MVLKWYVASSWKNAEVVKDTIDAIRNAGDQAFDFMHHSFDFDSLSYRDSKTDAVEDGRDKLPDNEWYNHPVVNTHFLIDRNALDECDALVAIFPCGNSSHIEIGIMEGQNKPVCAIVPKGINMKKDLLYKIFEKCIFQGLDDFINTMIVEQKKEIEVSKHAINRDDDNRV